jgi:hypothetical protein
MRPALPLPRPAAQHVAHAGPDDRPNDPGQAGRQMEHAQQHAERDQARRQRRDRHQHKPHETLADRGTELALNSRDDPRWGRSHVSPNITGPLGHPVTSTVREHPDEGDGQLPCVASATVPRTGARRRDCGLPGPGMSASQGVRHRRRSGTTAREDDQRRLTLAARPPFSETPQPGQNGTASADRRKGANGVAGRPRTDGLAPEVRPGCPSCRPGSSPHGRRTRRGR